MRNIKSIKNVQKQVRKQCTGVQLKWTVSFLHWRCLALYKVSVIKKVDIIFSSHDATTRFWNGIAFIRYAQNRNIVKQNNLNFLGAIKPKGLNRIAKIEYRFWKCPKILDMTKILSINTTSNFYILLKLKEIKLSKLHKSK
jgi:hypothetical protein